MGTFDNKTKGRYDSGMNDYDVNAEASADDNPLSQPNVAGESDYGLAPSGDPVQAHDEVVGEIQDENGEVVEVHLVKPSTPTAAPKSDFPLGKYGKFGVRASDPRIADRGPGVERLLSHLGVGGDTFTPEVEDQVRQVQEEKGLPVTGQVDRLTWDAITSL